MGPRSLSARSDHDKKRLHPHTIPCFASAKSPFWPQLGLRGTPRISHPDTEGQHCLRCNQHRAAQADWDWCEPSTPWLDSRTGGPARSRRKRSKPFPFNHFYCGDNRACLPSTLWKSSHWGPTRSGQAARWAKTRSCSRSLGLVPNSIESESPQVTSWVTPPEDPKWNPPLIPDTTPFAAEKGHQIQEGYGGS